MKHFLLIALLLCACGKDEPKPEKPADEPEQPEKPEKKKPSKELQLALDEALRKGDFEQAAEVVGKGADVNMPDDDGVRLINAICNHNVYRNPLGAARFLKKHGADLAVTDKDGWTPLVEATWWNNTRLMEFFVENGADVKAKTPGPIPRSTPNYTLLHIASIRIDVFALEWLLPKGIDVDAQNDLGETALLLAAEKGNLRSVTLLLAAGADKSIANKKGETALQLAQEGVEEWKNDDVNRVRYEKTAALLR